MDILFVFICVAVVFLGMIVGAVLLFRHSAKTKNKVSRVIGIILCVLAGLGILGLSLLIWALSQNPYPYP